MMSFFLFAATEESVTKDVTAGLTAGCGTIGAYDSASNSITLGADANGDNCLTTGTFIPAGTKAVVSVTMKLNGFRESMGGGLFFDPRPNPADRIGVGGGTGVLTWSGSGFSQFKTWSWNADFTPSAGDSWQDISGVLDTTDPSVSYTVTAEFSADNSVRMSITNQSTKATAVLGNAPVPFTNTRGVYVGCVMLNGSATFSDLKVTTFRPVYGDRFRPVIGSWSYDDTTGTLTGGGEGVGDHYIGTELFIAPGQQATVSADIKLNSFGNGCGAGLFFDTLPTDERTGLSSGMGVLTWSGDGFTQFKSWNWNPDKIATLNEQGEATDFWNPIENFTHGNTDKVYTVKAVFAKDGTVSLSITEKATGATHLLQNGALPLKNTEGIYVGLLSLNCQASFSSLTVEYPTEMPEPENPGTADAALPAILLCAASALLLLPVCHKKRPR